MKRVLITGARGFLGRHCLPLLLERGYEVHAVSRLPHRHPLFDNVACKLLQKTAESGLLERVVARNTADMPGNVRRLQRHFCQTAFTASASWNRNNTSNC